MRDCDVCSSTEHCNGLHREVALARALPREQALRHRSSRVAQIAPLRLRYNVFA